MASCHEIHTTKDIYIYTYRIIYIDSKAIDSIHSLYLDSFGARLAFLLPAALAARPCVELLIIGDYGTRDEPQAAVARGLARLAQQKQPEAVSAIGNSTRTRRFHGFMMKF